ncbi:pyrimidine dimer DNA glycosylase/endonuclease V, partial [Dokdonella sp.]|uniref:pyrimidine dimer DNA glycosylase/endonuclease V n=1 Tax=Dokdonella sp. TaxID=2291710 RepID=UPI0031B83909
MLLTGSSKPCGDGGSPLDHPSRPCFTAANFSGMFVLDCRRAAGRLNSGVRLHNMRLWSLHPRYLDPQGLVALWREALLAKAVLRGETRGYTQH